MVITNDAGLAEMAVNVLDWLHTGAKVVQKSEYGTNHRCMTGLIGSFNK